MQTITGTFRYYGTNLTVSLEVEPIPELIESLNALSSQEEAQALHSKIASGEIPLHQPKILSISQEFLLGEVAGKGPALYSAMDIDAILHAAEFQEGVARFLINPALGVKQEPYELLVFPNGKDPVVDKVYDEGLVYDSTPGAENSALKEVVEKVGNFYYGPPRTVDPDLQALIDGLSASGLEPRIIH